MMIHKYLTIALSLLLTSILHLPGPSEAAVYTPMTGAEFKAQLLLAQNNGEDDTFILAATTYDLSGGVSYEPAEDKAISIVGVGPNQTILDSGNNGQVLNINNQGAPNSGANAHVHISNLTFQNSAFIGGGGGGAEVFPEDGNLTIDNCHFINNNATFGGAALIASGGGDISITNSRMIDNFAEETGGGFSLFSNTGNITFVNNVFSDNRTDLNILNSDGGSVSASTGGVLTLTNNTIFNSRAALGGALSLASGTSIEVHNNILLDNSAVVSGNDIYLKDDVNNVGTPANLHNNIYADLFSDCQASAACTDAVNVANLSTQDPEFADQDNNDFKLTSSSPAINAGSANAPQLPATDLVGNDRVLGSAPDLGALEYDQPRIDEALLAAGLTFADTAIQTSTLSALLAATTSQSLQLTNNGGGPLNISALTLSDLDNYSLDNSAGPNPCGSDTPSIAAGTSCTMGINFTPISAGQKNASLTIESNAANTTSIQISLSGLGIESVPGTGPGSNPGGGAPSSGGCSLIRY